MQLWSPNMQRLTVFPRDLYTNFYFLFSSEQLNTKVLYEHNIYVLFTFKCFFTLFTGEIIFYLSINLCHVAFQSWVMKVFKVTHFAFKSLDYCLNVRYI